MMKMTRVSRLLTAGMMLFSLLFAQLAVAAYACPAFVSTSPMEQGMADCQQMQGDQPQSGLCAAHCEHAPQSADTPSAPAVAPFIPAALCMVLAPAEAALPLAALPDSAVPARTGAPSLIIRNCCFRI